MPIRADERLVQQGLASDLHRAQALVMEGRVLLGTRKILKPSEPVRKDAALWVKGEVDAYVSRGAHKLKRALEAFSLDIAGKTCVDVGASTGGFTDVMLRAGAARVFAVDVGYNLLDWKLRSDAPCLREFKFSILDDGRHYGEGLEGEQILLQGVVDCALLEPEGITVIDFKTDRVTEETIRTVAERYSLQVQTYADALSRIYEMPVKRKLLYFFNLDTFMEL